MKKFYPLLIFFISIYSLLGCKKDINQKSINSFTDPRDGEFYPTITIGSQTWMAENLRFNAPGSFLNSLNPNLQYGRLYDWATVMNGSSSSVGNPSGVQGICPSGWHIPSDIEWSLLEIALGLNPADTSYWGLYVGSHAISMKSTTGWKTTTGVNGQNGSNTSGFNVFPAGLYSSSIFGDLGHAAYFWTSTETDSINAGARFFHYGKSGVVRGGQGKIAGHSCRCLMN